MATNLSEQPIADAAVEVDLAALGLPATAQLSPLKAKGTHTFGVSGATLELKDIGPYQFGGALAGA